VVSFAFTVWLVSICRRLMHDQAVRLPVFLALVYLWANLHGMWVLAPMAVTLAFVAAMFANPVQTWRRWPEALAMVAGSFLVAALTPAGPRLAIWWITVRKAAAGVSEWQATPLWNHQAACFLVLILVILVSWVFGAERPGRPEGVWVLGIVLFSLSASRNIAPASLMLAPFAADGLERLRRAGATSRSWPRVPAWTLAVPVALTAAALSLVVVSTPRLPPDLPTRIVAGLQDRPENPVRVLNDFNIGGLLTGLGAPKVSVALDGRIDNYPLDYIRDYWSLERGVGLDAYLSRYHPDVAVLRDSSPLVPLLEARGWHVDLVDNGWLLVAPADG
jgi:hypothetical protein